MGQVSPLISLLRRYPISRLAALGTQERPRNTTKQCDKENWGSQSTVKGPGYCITDPALPPAPEATLAKSY